MYETIVGVIAKPMGVLLYFLYSFIDNYGITMIVFTLIVRGCLFPLYAAQMKSTIKMQDVQPKMQELQKRYANDKETLNVKMMELYKEEKFNPMSGCLPMLIQMPIILGIFALLRNPIAFISNTDMLMAIHESFLWIPDLSQPDEWILPLLAGISTYFSYIFMQSQQTASAGENPAMNMMKMMKYFFPIMIFWMGRSFPAALTIYWFIGTLFSVVQSIGMNAWKKKKLAEREAAKKKKSKAASAR